LSDRKSASQARSYSPNLAEQSFLLLRFNEVPPHSGRNCAEQSDSGSRE